MKAFKFQFDVVIEKIEIAITFQCQTSVIWKRGKSLPLILIKPKVLRSKQD